MTELKKRDVERMMTAYERDPVAALTAALRVALDRPDLGFTALVKVAGFDCARRIRLQAKDAQALDELCAELNELRTVAR
ncbi:MAG: hypothetical protein ACOYMR_12235 [Ilumatobacteraceae bacterium]